MSHGKASSRVAFALVASLFLCWGVANNMNDTLLAAFRRIMSMSDLQTSLVQFAFYGAYFCFAIPAAIFIRRFSYKAGILLGLALYAAGCMLFYPAGIASSYPFFLIAIYVMASGCSILETTANPYIMAMGDPRTATRRLNLAQTLNPVGAICGILLSRHFILAQLHSADAAQRSGMDADALIAIQHQELSAVSGTYMAIGCILIALMVTVALIRMPAGSGSDGSDATTPRPSARETTRRLWRNTHYRYGVVAQFFYVGVQTGVWSFTIRLAMHQLGILEKDASIAFLYSILAFMLFRFIFTWLMAYIKPLRLLYAASLMALLFTLAVIFTSGWVCIGFLIAISACMSLMFPTIYGIALEDVAPADTKLGASGLIMAILGGALITPLQAFISDRAGISASFAIPALCFAVILIYCSYISKTEHARHHDI
ncbi:MAG: L-fucose:H+ symporter permease [Bacteroidales bacterium]|nr:L-fucose:H+ symporter permease [Bacteroidales bacterium]